MIRRNFRLNIILRILIITGVIVLATYYALVESNWIRFSYLSVFLIILVWEMIFYVDRTNRDLNSFFIALLQNDFSTSFTEINRGRSFKELYSTIGKITKRFKEVSIEKEKQLLFLEMLVEHVRSGIISFDKNEKIYLMNQALQRLLKKPKLHYLKAFSNTDPELLKTLREIKPGQQKLLKIKVNEELLQLMIHSSEFKIGEESFKLLSIQDIKTELEVNEVETWQKLIRVLTHEIMNSVAPITSLSDTMLGIVSSKKSDGSFDTSDIQNLYSGLEAVKMRSSGLQNFTDAYRKLTRIPRPNFQQIEINEFLQKVILLHRSHYNNFEGEIIFNSKKEYKVMGDPDLLSQVILNILKNSYEANLESDNPSIKIEISSSARLEIRISDNGPGISQDIIDQIFVPFFTTKANGSGIGLALSRQIMHMHKGSLNVESSSGEGAEFILKL